MPLPEFADDRPLFSEERAIEALRILARGLQLGGARLNHPVRGAASPSWEARAAGHGASGPSATTAARRLIASVALSGKVGAIGLADDALDAISEAYALVGNFDASNWQTGEVTPC